MSKQFFECLLTGLVDGKIRSKETNMCSVRRQIAILQKFGT